MEDYLSRRKILIEEEKTLRHDHGFRQRLSTVEKKACEIVRRIREEEIKSTWTDQSNEEIFTAMSFPLAKQRIETTKLWEIVRALPKGALLHAHFGGMVDMKWLMETALSTPGIHIKSNVPLSSSEALSTALLQFQFIPEKVTNNGSVDIFSPEYPPNSLVQLRKAAKTFPRGGTNAFVDYLVTRVTVAPAEASQQHKGLDTIWAIFESVFPILGGLIFYEPIFRITARKMFEELLVDGVQWVDTRLVLLGVFQLAAGEAGTTMDIVNVFQEELLAFQATPKGSSFWGARIIWTVPRGCSQETVEADMRRCLAAKHKYPSVVAGYDLVSQEGLGRTLLEHMPSLLWFRAQCEAEGVDIPFFFHAGEVLGDGDAHDKNLFDAILLGTKRIGHGYSLFKHPLLIEKAKRGDICIEICPISNEVLRLNNSVAAHPLPALLANGVATAISSDVPAIWHAGSCVSYDFWQVLQAFENVGLEGLGDMAETSIWYAAFDNGVGGEEEMGSDKATKTLVREKRVQEWRKRWSDYSEWIVANFDQDSKKPHALHL